MSTAMTAPADCAAHPMITDKPTPPHPSTTVLAPTGTWTVFVAAPKPVATAQPTTAARSSGIPSAMRTAPPSGTTAYSPKEPTARKL
jgi:hypothetical protein